MNKTEYTVTLWSKLKTGYGHWRITCKVTGHDNNGDEYYDEVLTHTTTNSRAIDGHDGGDQALVRECLRENDFEDEDFDLSDVSAGDEDDE